MASTDFNLQTIGTSVVGVANFDFSGATISGVIFESVSEMVVSYISTPVVISGIVFESVSEINVSMVDVSGWSNIIMGIDYLQIQKICGVGIDSIKEKNIL